MKKYKKKNILKISVIMFSFLFIVSSVPSFAAETKIDNFKIETKYIIDRPQIKHVNIDSVVYDEISVSGELGNFKPGAPDLPAIGANILIPQGANIVDIDILTGEKVHLGSDFYVIPSRSHYKLLEKNMPLNIKKDEVIYSSENVFPDNLYTKIGTYFFRGYEILVLSLYPVQYIPATGDLYYFKDLTVKINTEENVKTNPLFRNLEKDVNEVVKKVDNPQIQNSYSKLPDIASSSDEYDLLILTTEDLASHFEPLKNMHDSQGISTEIKTLRDISIFPGYVTTEDIRDFIRDEYSDYGIEYVLIGGDNDVVPAKDLWVRAWSGGDTTFMPSDLYYSCLDGTYNFDEDELWGEPEDGDYGEDVDLVSEIYIGRACVGSTDEVDNFVGKTITYINSGGYSDGDVLMVGEYLWDDPDTWGGDYMDEMIDGSTAHYTTTGIPSDEYDISTLYERDWQENDWPKSEIITQINSGSRIINHLGHSSYNYNMKMDSSDVSSLTNSEPCFIYSQGCMAGGFDNGDCIAEYFTVKTDTAAFAVIMNARYGWGVKGGTDGASQRFHRQFWDAIFEENITQIGKANQDSKEDNLFRINGNCMRWCYYQTNLLGDPTLSFYTSENTRPDKPMRPTGEELGSIGESYYFTSTTSDQDGDIIYYKWDFGDGTFSEWLGPYESGEIVNVSHKWRYIGKYEVKVKARDEHRAESDWSEPLSLKMPILYQFPLIRLIIDFLENHFPLIFSLFTII